MGTDKQMIKYHEAKQKPPYLRTPEDWEAIYNVGPGIIQAKMKSKKEGLTADWMDEFSKNASTAMFFLSFIHEVNHNNKKELSLEECARVYKTVIKPVGEEYLRKKLKKAINQGWLKSRKHGHFNYYSLALTPTSAKIGVELAAEKLGMDPEKILKKK